MIYIPITAVLIFAVFIYCQFAIKYNITDKPDSRRSHNTSTIRGAGIIFPLSAMIWFYLNGIADIYFFLGLIFISLISFLDDLVNLKPINRMITHICAAFLLALQFDLFSLHPLILLLIIILIVGWFNASNFMDGINGITPLYSFLCLSFLYMIGYNENIYDIDFIRIVMLSLLIFSFLNFRKQAIAFAGDVGSISLSYIIAFLMLSLMISTGELSYILFLSVYGIDSAITIIQRLLKREDIFKPHRTHLYQYLANEKKWSHLLISAIYSLIQLFINLSVIFIIIPSEHSISLSILVLSVLISIYLIIKNKVSKFS